MFQSKEGILTFTGQPDQHYDYDVVLRNGRIRTTTRWQKQTYMTAIARGQKLSSKEKQW